MAKRLPKRKILSLIQVLQKTAKQIEEKLAKQTVRRPTGAVYSACVRQALSLLNEQLHHPINHSELARLCHVSYSTLRITFLREMGTTLGHYHLALRLEEAGRLLAQTALPVTEIAARIGFCNQKHFSAIFKRKKGVSPMVWRQQMRKEKGSVTPERPNLTDQQRQ